MKHLHPRRWAIACSIGALMSIGASTRPQRADPLRTVGPGAADTNRVAALCLRGLEDGYSLDYPEALAAFEEALRVDPEDSNAHRLVAATLWMRVLFQQGAVTVEDYLGHARAKLDRPAPPADMARAFHQHVDRALSLAEGQIRNNPADAAAYFHLGAAAGLRASYMATVEGRVRDSVGAARRAYRAHKRCMTLDPHRKDAALIVGLYQYAVASLPLPLRLMARFAGFESGRENGLRLVEEAAQDSRNVQTQTNALFTLALLYSREGRHADALRIIRQLQHRYPRNRLLLLEAGSAALRAGRPAEALRSLNEGFERLSADSRPRAYGEDARWRYLRGAALVALRDADAAHRDLQTVLTDDAHAWIRGRAHVELGKLADLSGDRRRAIAAYRHAIEECHLDRDSTCSDEAKKLITAGYR